jgi:hypothetical protein
MLREEKELRADLFPVILVTLMIVLLHLAEVFVWAAFFAPTANHEE